MYSTITLTADEIKMDGVRREKAAMANFIVIASPEQFIL